MCTSLEINEKLPVEGNEHSSNLLFRTFVTPYKSGRFSFIQNISAKSVPKKNTHWKSPKIIYGKRWYVSYYYLNANRKWQRFRVFEDINRIKTKEYASLLRDAVQVALEDGYNPFAIEEQVRKEEAQGIIRDKEWTIQQALNYFKQKWGERGLEGPSLTRYESVADRLSAWLTLAGLQHTPAEQINISHIEAELSHYKKKSSWSNRTYNNELNFLATIFKFLLKKKIVKDNPCTDVDKQKAQTIKHKYYDDKLLVKVKDAMFQHDEYLSFAAECIYSLCIRSEKELKHFKIGNIFPDRKQCLITAGGSKVKADRFIPMTDQTVDKFKERGIFELPGDWYVFGRLGKPGPAPFGKEWFSKKFRKVREGLKLSGDYTLYSFRHTRAVHLKLDGATDAQIMSLMGHTDFATTSKYLRDLGLSVDIEGIQKKSRAW